MSDSGRNVSRHFFDVVTVSDGPHTGLRVVAIGKSKRHRNRAANLLIVCCILFGSLRDNATATADTNSHFKVVGTPFSFLEVEFQIMPLQPPQPPVPALSDETAHSEDERQGVWAILDV